jgi:carboxyl-terminal processing protease
MNKKTQIWLPFLFSLFLLAGMFLGYKLKENMGIYSPAFPSAKKQSSLKEILSIIDRHYVDSVNLDSLSFNAISSILQKLDPHSVYIPEKDVRIMQEELQGNFEGIGVEFELLRDTVCVVGIQTGSPAEKAGIRAGYQLLKVNQQAVSGVRMPVEKIRSLVRGPKGTELEISMFAGQSVQTIKLKRGRINQECIDLAWMVKPGVGYIRLNRFASTAYEEFMQELENLKKEKINTLILDLRDNGGGIMDDAVQMADEFLDDSKEIVYTLGKSSSRQSFQAKRPGLFEDGKLMVLINEHSASASEVLAGALQDWDRATIIGRRSFGKGLVQEQFNLSDGSALRLTVSRYFTPIGRNIQKPYLSGNDSAYNNELLHRYTNGSLLRNDTSDHNGKVYITKGGRKVYGGGGISPDLFVPADSTELILANRYSLLVSEAKAITFHFYVQNKSALQALKTGNQIDQHIQNNPEFKGLLEKTIQKDSAASKYFTLVQKEKLQQLMIDYLIRLAAGKKIYLQHALMPDPVLQTALNQKTQN